MVPQGVQVMPAGRPSTLGSWLKHRAPKCSCRYRFPLVVVNRDPSSAGENSAMCAARVSATTVGNGTVRRDLGVLGDTRCLPSWVSCHSTRTVRRRKSTSSRRNASSSAMRSPRPAWMMIIARQRSGIASASACTWATVSGTIRAFSDLGRLSRADRARCD